jgi:hypothetical protein
MLTVFGTTFSFLASPRFVQYAMQKLVRVWGSDLDVDAPVCVRVFAKRTLRKFGVPGTPL